MTKYGVDGSGVAHVVDCCPTLRGKDYHPLKGAQASKRRMCKACGPLANTVRLLQRISHVQ